MILALVSSRAIYLLNVDFVSDVSDAISASIIRDFCNECCVGTLCIYAHSEREDKVGRGNETQYVKGDQENVSSPGFKVPRQCSFVLLLDIRLRKGKALESNKAIL
jgi:hypothetical protein